jgi:Holliday junction DNA helicase RuvA
MIAEVRGILAAKIGDRVVVATAGGVSYEVAVPIGVLERLPAEGVEVQLSTVPIVREDGWALYGFDDADERLVFQRLLGVNGVGPRLALAIVSTLGRRVVKVLKEGEIAAMCTVPGVGKRTAERIALELKDKLRDIGTQDEAAAAVYLPAEQAVHALVNLGYNASDADRAVRRVLSENGSAQTAELIRESLQLLTRAR